MRRKGIVHVPGIIEGADSWKKGFVLTLKLKNETVPAAFRFVETPLAMNSFSFLIIESPLTHYQRTSNKIFNKR